MKTYHHPHLIEKFNFLPIALAIKATEACLEYEKENVSQGDFDTKMRWVACQETLNNPYNTSITHADLLDMISEFEDDESICLNNIQDYWRKIFQS